LIFDGHFDWRPQRALLEHINVPEIFSMMLSHKRFAVIQLFGLMLLADMPASATDLIVAGHSHYEPAVLQSPKAWYAAARTGAAWMDDTTFESVPVVTNSYDTGPNFGASLGRQFILRGVSTRAEIEIGYQIAHVVSHDVPGVGVFPSPAGFGSTSVLYGLTNAYVDLARIDSAFKPFVGAGVGVADVNVHDHGIAPVLGATDGSGIGFAWQAGAGASYALNDRVSLEVGYRYLSVEDAVGSHQLNTGFRIGF
jgi:opacity protein-like surface antigen